MGALRRWQAVGPGSARLSDAREKGIVECAYVESDVVPECQWFATPVEIGPNGIEKNLGLGELDAFEKEKLSEAITELIPSITEGVEFVAAMEEKKVA